MRQRCNTLERKVLRPQKPHLYKALGKWHCRTLEEGYVVLRPGRSTPYEAFHVPPY